MAIYMMLKSKVIQNLTTLLPESNLNLLLSNVVQCFSH